MWGFVWREEVKWSVYMIWCQTLRSMWCFCSTVTVLPPDWQTASVPQPAAHIYGPVPVWAVQAVLKSFLWLGLAGHPQNHRASCLHWSGLYIFYSVLLTGNTLVCDWGALIYTPGRNTGPADQIILKEFLKREGGLVGECEVYYVWPVGLLTNLSQRRHKSALLLLHSQWHK